MTVTLLCYPVSTNIKDFIIHFNNAHVYTLLPLHFII